MVAAITQEVRILLFGGSGQLGKSIVCELDKRDMKFFAPKSNEMSLPLSETAIAELIRFNPTTIINCAAWTNVDLAEKEPAHALLVNVLGTQNICDVAMGSGATLMHISTDYVFSGDNTSPWLETDQKFTVTVYGRSKSYAEDIVLSQLGNQSWIVRTAWLYSPYRKNFPMTILKKLLFSEENISVVDDQIGQPTSAEQLASVLVEMVVNDFPKGIYHGTNRGETSWFGFATALASLAGKETSRVIPMPTSAYKSLAVRPKYSVLSHAGWRDSPIFTLETWENALQEMFPKLIGSLSQHGEK